MKVKIIGFKVGFSRPTANKMIDLNKTPLCPECFCEKKLSKAILAVLKISDFISIRRIE